MHKRHANIFLSTYYILFQAILQRTESYEVIPRLSKLYEMRITVNELVYTHEVTAELLGFNRLKTQDKSH